MEAVIGQIFKEMGAGVGGGGESSVRRGAQENSCVKLGQDRAVIKITKN